MYWGGLQTDAFGSVSARAQYVSHIISILFSYYFHIVSILLPYYFHIFLEKYEKEKIWKEYGSHGFQNVGKIMEKIWNKCGKNGIHIEKIWNAYRRNMEYI